MANLKQELKITTPLESFTFNNTEPYNEVFTVRKAVDNIDTFMTLWTGSKTSGTYGYDDVKAIVIRNTSRSPVEVQIKAEGYEGSTSATLDTRSASRYMSFMLRGNEYIYLPGIRMVGYDADESAANAGVIDNKRGYEINAGKLYGDTGTNLGAHLENTETQVTVGDTDFFRVGDLIQLGTTTGTTATNIEIMRVTEITNATVMQVDRQLFGSILGDKDAQTTGHVSGADVFFPWFNTTNKYNKYHDDANALGKVQTDDNGRYTATNLFGTGRNATEACTGIVPGSLALKFYTRGYQELGLSGISAATDTGLTAGTAYQFTIAVDGGSAYDVDITIDSSNTKFGGTNGLIPKLNSIFNTQFSTSGSNLFEKRVSCSIVNGDLRFTSGSRTSASAVSLGDSSGGDTDIWGVGRIPAVANVETAVSAKLPNDTVFDRAGMVTLPNVGIFSFDDGHGNITGGEASGTINYETGAISLSGPRNAEFAASFVHDSAHSGGNHFGSNTQNCINEIGARSINSKVNPTVEIIGFN